MVSWSQGLGLVVPRVIFIRRSVPRAVPTVAQDGGSGSEPALRDPGSGQRHRELTRRRAEIEASEDGERWDGLA